MDNPKTHKSVKDVPLEIEFEIQVKSSYYHIELAKGVNNILSNTVNHIGKKGFFHRDNITPGQPIFLSSIMNLINSIEGIKSVKPVIFRRLGEQDKLDLYAGFIHIGSNEIARLDNNPNKPQNGTLKIKAPGEK